MVNYGPVNIPRPKRDADENEIEQTRRALEDAALHHPTIKCGCGAPAIGGIRPEGTSFIFVCGGCMVAVMYGGKRAGS